MNVVGWQRITPDGTDRLHFCRILRDSWLDYLGGEGEELTCLNFTGSETIINVVNARLMGVSQLFTCGGPQQQDFALRQLRDAVQNLHPIMSQPWERTARYHSAANTIPMCLV